MAIRAAELGGIFRGRSKPVVAPSLWPDIPSDTRNRLKEANPHIFGVSRTSQPQETVLVSDQPIQVEKNPTAPTGRRYVFPRTGR